MVPAVGLRQAGDRECTQDLGAAEQRHIQSGGDPVEQLEEDRGERKVTAAAAPADPAEWHIPQTLLCQGLVGGFHVAGAGMVGGGGAGKAGSWRDQAEPR